MAKIATCQERLNELFEKDPRSNSAIGDSLGVSKQTISAWRNGERSPKKTMITKIAEHYNVSEEWLYGWDLPTPSFLLKENDNAPVPSDENGQISEIVNLLKKLSSNTRAEVLHYVQFRVNTEEAE